VVSQGVLLLSSGASSAHRLPAAAGLFSLQPTVLDLFSLLASGPRGAPKTPQPQTNTRPHQPLSLLSTDSSPPPLVAGGSEAARQRKGDHPFPFYGFFRPPRRDTVALDGRC
jgi:hypothetical protein